MLTIGESMWFCYYKLKYYQLCIILWIKFVESNIESSIVIMNCACCVSLFLFLPFHLFHFPLYKTFFLCILSSIQTVLSLCFNCFFCFFYLLFFSRSNLIVVVSIVLNPALSGTNPL